tara:strand:+ start:710 stop:1924 length:1215 start_codon:yes stop_codon:yes gene_type:complete
MKKTVKYFNEFLILLFVFAVIIFLSQIGMGRIGTLVLIPIGLWYFLLGRKGRAKYIFNIKGVKWYLIFILLTSISILYSIDPLVALLTQLKLIIVFAFSISVFSYCLESFRNVKVLYFANLIVLFYLFIYTYYNGIDIGSAERINEDVFNANTYGYFIFIGMHSLFSLYIMTKRKEIKFFFLVLIVVASIFSFALVLASASRGALLVTFGLIIGNVFIILNLNKKSVLRKFVFLFITVSLVFYSVQYGYDNYFENSLVEQRFNQLEQMETPREFHLQKAIEIGFENPIFGVGSGNYAIIPKKIEQGSFTHNSFAEIFANNGFPGLIVLLGFLSCIFLKLKKMLSFKNEKLKVSLYQIYLFLILFFFHGFLYVFYLDTIFLHFLFVIYAHLIIMERSIHQNNNIK